MGEPAGVAGGAGVEEESVDHAVAVEEVVAGGGEEKRVGAVSEVDAGDGGGDGAGDGEGVADGLFRNRREVSSDLDFWVGGFWKRVLEFMGK